jgi:hypothetical protein
MFLLHDPKKLAALIIAKKDSGGVPHDEPESDELKMAEEDAAKALLAAIEAKDPVGLFEAIETCYDLCEQHSDEPEKEGEGAY